MRTPSARSCRSATSCAGSWPSWRARPRAPRSGPSRRGLAARATAEQALQAVRRELEAVRLQAEVVVPSEIKREAAALAAAGQAATIAEDGRASAESLRLVADAWKAAGPSAPDMFLINKLEEITRIVVDSVGQIQLGPVQLIDGGDGQTFPRFAAAYPQAVATVLRVARRDDRRRRDLAAHAGRRRAVTRAAAGPAPARPRREVRDDADHHAARPRDRVRGRAVDGADALPLHLPAQRGAGVLGRAARVGGPQGRLPHHQGRARAAHPAARDRRFDGPDEHADRGRRAGRVLEGRHSGQRSRHRQREDRGRAAGARQRDRTVPGRRSRRASWRSPRTRWRATCAACWRR